MSFTRRYLLWLLIPPIFISIPPALLFLSQVVQLTEGSALGLALLLVVTYLGGCASFTFGVRGYAEAVETALEGKGDPSSAMSACLDRTKSLSFLLWGVGGLVFAIIAASLFMRSALGLAYFVVAVLISAFVSVVWGYAMGKHRLTEAAAAAGLRVHYTGHELSLGKKIAIVFIGSLTISMAALILLVSSRVSTTLESPGHHLRGGPLPARLRKREHPGPCRRAALDTLRYYIPAEYSLHVIDPKGTVVEHEEARSCRKRSTPSAGSATATASASSRPHVMPVPAAEERLDPGAGHPLDAVSATSPVRSRSTRSSWRC